VVLLDDLVGQSKQLWEVVAFEEERGITKT
jgi:hypothetical protein